MSIHYPGFQSFQFGFENCETADIRVSFIGGVQINNIKLSLGRFSQDKLIDYKKSCKPIRAALADLLNTKQHWI